MVKLKKRLMFTLLRPRHIWRGHKLWILKLILNHETYKKICSTSRTNLTGEPLSLVKRMHPLANKRWEKLGPSQKNLYRLANIVMNRMLDHKWHFFPCIEEINKVGVNLLILNPFRFETFKFFTIPFKLIMEEGDPNLVKVNLKKSQFTLSYAFSKSILNNKRSFLHFLLCILLTIYCSIMTLSKVPLLKLK